MAEVEFDELLEVSEALPCCELITTHGPVEHFMISVVLCWTVAVWRTVAV